jgi:uncharacterized protein YndB with AHSA1/START domain
MTSMTPVRARTRVNASVERTFEAFTAEVDAWWRRGPRFRFDADGREGTLAFEPRVGGRFVERYEPGDERVVGEVLGWQPPHRIVFRLLPPVPSGGEGTRVEVTFTATDDGRTEVVLEHHGLEHVEARHRSQGLRGTALRSVTSVWWADLLVAFANHR